LFLGLLPFVVSVAVVVVCIHIVSAANVDANHIGIRLHAFLLIIFIS
jgi:hypothetical protein